MLVLPIALQCAMILSMANVTDSFVDNRIRVFVIIWLLLQMHFPLDKQYTPV